jgi:hypothetical protein
MFKRLKKIDINSVTDQITVHKDIAVLLKRWIQKILIFKLLTLIKVKNNPEIY